MIRAVKCDFVDRRSMSKRRVKRCAQNRMKLRQSAGVLFIVALLAMIIYTVMYTAEGFTSSPPRCGVGMPSCQGERVRCINGYCRSDVAPKLPLFSDLPLAH
jgi:hypothetical protein